ncbi:hypothetical protein [uncultured Chryseobacterium sp.]|uniref:hypothetical protein n=1 Tax=uncultured Chryseobacterium sp. TaxID=259322 RepID=UPI0025FE9A96|nr:hypothetical protein [uncultured Chryseobacterium sp.]
MINIVLEFKKYRDSIPHLIQKSDYKTGYFIKLLGLKTPTYYRKLKENSFSMEEIELLTKALYSKEALLMELQDAEDDYAKGNVREHSEFTEVLRQEFL